MNAAPSAHLDDLVELGFSDLDGRVREELRTIRAAQLRLGRILAAVERRGKRDGFTPFGVTTFSIYLESRGISSREGYQMRDAALAGEESPELAKAVEQTKLSVPKAALLKDWLTKPELQKPGEDPLAVAQKLTTYQVRNELNKRKRDAQLGEKSVARTHHFSQQGVDDLTRTRELESSRQKRRVSESEAIEVALHEYVDRHCPEERARRREATNGKPKRSRDEKVQTRYISADDRHRIIRHFGDRCWVDGCDERAFLEFAHLKPFRFAGKNRFWNLARLCFAHHRQYDAGQWQIKPHGEKALLVDVRGIPFGRLRGLPPRGPP